MVYGPNVNAAAILLGSEGNVPIERTAMLMQALLGTPVSVGFVARALARLAERLAAAGFDAAMKDALRAEDVLCGDETAVNVISKDLDEGGNVVPGQPQAVVLRTPDARLVWYAATGSRSKDALKGLGVLDGYRGYLVGDDYAGYRQFEADLAGRQQCCAHYPDLRIIPTVAWSVLVGGGARAGLVGIITALRGRREAGRVAGSGRGRCSAGWSGSALVL